MYYVYGYEGCGYCLLAKDLLEVLKLDMTYYDIRKDLTKKEELFKKRPGVTKVPQIFYNDEYIGGFTELNAKLSS